MRSDRSWLWILLLGSVWGLIEVVFGEMLFAREVPFASAWLTAGVLGVLVVARLLIHQPGSSTVVGGVATLYKLATVSPHFCHLLAIFLVGASFDLFASLLVRRPERQKVAMIAVAGFSVYLARVLFGCASLYIIQMAHWIERGTPYLLHHIFIGGSIAAALSALITLPSLRLGEWMSTRPDAHPRLVTASMLAGATLCWAVGFIAV